MDGFPNGRRLEDDVTRIELQAVGGIVLAAIGLWYDDYTAGGPNPVTTDLLDVLTYTTGVEENDTTFRTIVPVCSNTVERIRTLWCNEFFQHQACLKSALNLSAPELSMVQNYPNPFTESTTFKYHVAQNAVMSILQFLT